MASSHPGTTSILQAVEMRGGSDTRPSYFVYVVLPVLLVLGGLVVAAILALFVLSVSAFPDAANDAAVQQWFENNISSLLSAVAIFGLAFVAALVLLVIGAYKLIKRRNEHFARDRVLRQGLLEYARSQADDEATKHLEAMERIHNEALLEENERSAALHLIISFLTFGLWFYYVVYFLLKDFPRHSRRQTRFLRQANEVLATSGAAEPEALPTVEPIPERSFMLYVGLVVLLPLFGGAVLSGAGLSDLYTMPLNLVSTGATLVFWYWIYNEPNAHFDRQWRYEDRVVELVQEAPAPEPEEPADEAEEASAPDTSDGPAQPGAQGAEEAPAPQYTVWACQACGKKYKVPPKRPVRVTCKNCGNQEILRD